MCRFDLSFRFTHQKYTAHSYLLAIFGAAYIPTAEAGGFTPSSVTVRSFARPRVEAAIGGRKTRALCIVDSHL